MEKGQQLHARDSPRRVFWAFCIVCWIAWLAIGGFTAGALYLVNQGHELMTREEVLNTFWWMTYLCIGLPLAVWGFIRVVERYERKKS